MALKQNLKDAVKISRKTFFNPTGWFGYQLFVSQTELTANFIRRLFVPEQAGRQETFAQAMTRMKLTEKDIQRIKQQYLYYTIFFIALGISVVLYGLYLLIHHGSFAGLLLAFATAGLALVNAFRFHFLWFQICHRKLGCTFNEWLSGKVSGDDQSP